MRYFQQILLLFILTYAYPSHLWANNVTKVSVENDIENVKDVMFHDSEWSPLDAMIRANKVNSVALETFGELNQFWGNAIKTFLSLTEHLEHGILAVLRVIFPDLFDDLNPSDLELETVTRSPHRMLFFIKELIAAFLSSTKKNLNSASSSDQRTSAD